MVLWYAICLACRLRFFGSNLRQVRGGGHLIGRKMSNKTREFTSRIPWARCPGWVLVGLVLCGLSQIIPAQVVHYPDSQDLDSPRSGNSILSGMGGGAEMPAGTAPGNRIEVADAVAHRKNASSWKPRFLEWERWWHGQLYGILAKERFSASKAGDDKIDLDLLINRDVLDILRRQFEFGTVDERSAAAVALARLGSKSISNDLIFSLRSAPLKVQSAILLAFGISGAEDARSLLSAVALNKRFGRRALGQPRQSIAKELRCVALLALGMLPAKKSDDTLHQVLSAPTEFDRELYRAACLALGLHAVTSAEEQRQARRYGRTVRSWNLCVEYEEAYLAKLDSDDLSDTCKSLLLLSLARSLPSKGALVTKVISLLASDNVVLSRSAAVAAAVLGVTKSKELNAALWRRLNKGGDAATTGLVLLALGRHASDNDFNALMKLRKVDATSRPYLAFALVSAATENESRRLKASQAVRTLVQASSFDDGIGLGGICVALGLLGDVSAEKLLQEIHNDHPMMTARSAAGLALGLLGSDGISESIWSETKRANGFLVHDGALALALSKDASAADKLCRALKSRGDAYSLGGIAQALGLLKCATSIPALCKIIEDKKSSSQVRTFAIGALGLVLEGNPGAWSRNLRTLAPVPVASPILANILAHL